MYEHGAAWTIEGPDGTTVAFNTPGSPFYLEDVTGFDSPSVRTLVEVRPEYDGAVAGPSFLGARPVTMRGRVIAASAAERNLAVVELQRALRALRADLTLRSTASGLEPMQAGARLESARVTGGFAKEFLIGLICPDPRIYSQELHSLLSTAAAAGSVVGAPWPLAWPANWGGGSGADAYLEVENLGNFDAPPRLRAHGPISDPSLHNITSGLSLWLDNLSLAADEWVEVDMAARTATTFIGTNVYAKVRFPDSDWWSLEPGVNALSLRSSVAAVGVGLTAYWRDAWV